MHPENLISILKNERLAKILGNVQFPQIAPFLDLLNACKCPYCSIIGALHRPFGAAKGNNVYILFQNLWKEKAERT